MELKYALLEKKYEKNESNYLRFGTCSMQGWRARMEDSYINEINIGDKKQYNIFGIFDGHRGKETSQFVKNHFIEELLLNDNFKKENICLALKETFFKMDELMLSSKGKKELIQLHSQSLKDDIKLKEKNIILKLPFQPLTHYNSGCTACICIIDILNKTIYFANVGDSKGILIKNNIAKKITSEHNSYNLNENKRIINAGGIILDNRIYYNNGLINVSRSLGDLDFKRNKNLSKENQIITSEPDIFVEKFNEGDFIILCCDGVWECFDNVQEIYDFIKDNLNNEKNYCGIINSNLCYDNCNLSKIIGKMFDCIVAKNMDGNFSGYDNMSCICIQIKNNLN